MKLAVVRSRANFGLQAPSVIIEVHLSPGLPGLSIVGLPETAVKEVAIESEAPLSIVDLNFRSGGSPLTLRLWICQRKVDVLICPLP